MRNYDSFVAAAAASNLKRIAIEQTCSAAEVGTNIVAETHVYVNDGSKNWPTTLAMVLCSNPELAAGTREDMAEIITKELRLRTLFVASRLSRELSSKAKKMVSKILNDNGYNTAELKTGLDIRNVVKAGKEVCDTGNHTITTKFEADGVWLGRKWYPYERFVTYETGSPWYYLGLRFAGDLVQLKTVLAMREIGVGQFIEQDEAAQRRANTDQSARRRMLSG